MIVNLFAGHGVDVGARMAGLPDGVGFELDGDTCATRAIHGMPTIRADVSTWPLEPLRGRVSGLWASPPCQDWSLAGSRTERAGRTGWLVDEPLRWAEALEPEWIVCEQVPPALKVWKSHVERLEELGWSTWAGILNSADYGVPQTRKRAFLLARRGRPPVPPRPTHVAPKNRDPQLSLLDAERRPWVTMADALGWPSSAEVRSWRGAGMVARHGTRPPCMGDQPAPTLTTAPGRRWKILHTNRGQREDGSRQVIDALANPAPTFTARSGGQWKIERRPGRPSSQFSKDPVRVTLAEALTLQSYPAGFAVAGSKTSRFRQVGNAVPPLLARRILESVVR